MDMYQLFLSLHILSAIAVWLTSFYGITQLIVNKRSIDQIGLIGSLSVAAITGVILGLNSGAAVLAVCLKLGLYLSPSLLYFVTKYFVNSAVNAK